MNSYSPEYPQWHCAIYSRLAQYICASHQDGSLDVCVDCAPMKNFDSFNSQATQALIFIPHTFVVGAMFLTPHPTACLVIRLNTYDNHIHSVYT